MRTRAAQLLAIAALLFAQPADPDRVPDPTEAGRTPLTHHVASATRCIEFEDGSGICGTNYRIDSEGRWAFDTIEATYCIQGRDCE